MLEDFKDMYNSQVPALYPQDEVGNYNQDYNFSSPVGHGYEIIEEYPEDSLSDYEDSSYPYEESYDYALPVEDYYTDPLGNGESFIDSLFDGDDSQFEDDSLYPQEYDDEEDSSYNPYPEYEVESRIPGRAAQEHGVAFHHYPPPDSGAKNTGNRKHALNYEQQFLHLLALSHGGSNRHPYNLPSMIAAYRHLAAEAHGGAAASMNTQAQKARDEGKHKLAKVLQDKADAHLRLAKYHDERRGSYGDAVLKNIKEHESRGKSLANDVKKSRIELEKRQAEKKALHDEIQHHKDKYLEARRRGFHSGAKIHAENMNRLRNGIEEKSSAIQKAHENHERAKKALARHARSGPYAGRGTGTVGQGISERNFSGLRNHNPNNFYPEDM